MRPAVFGFYHMTRKAKLTILTLAVTVFFTTGVVYVQAYHKLKPIFEVPTNKKIVALTFDISWGNTTPMPVIEILKKEAVRCTFFLSGPWVRQYPDIPQRIKADGHEIGSHGNRHVNLSTLSKAEIKKEIEEAHKAIQEVTGIEPNLIRTPNGDYNDTVIQTAEECNYRVIQWSVDSLDWMNPGVDIIVERVTKKVHPGAIILMHASDTCKQTTEALPRIIQGLKREGYELVTVSELLREAEKH
ncbi:MULTISPECIES: polysaccharide deacetylase family sporulation protein PdaB [Syntrophothermus]|uniref:Polysaccharide deacetylase family sporulation protein PdaB n=1 Tax=Syntrophothermus lipocalidus (strain DSM 12680 / TGB-C1) TaxID=643648 RepID=D7CNJ1_SYNLT|nr:MULTISPECIES: polysaccharide deacetylase family sporulation protein PdaB [Syntrophothermus]ADI02276.1 polysaccharide deacetylase family sporulation protein PdaB [Syntrophothermus lipocalidus DSM 12680]